MTSPRFIFYSHDGCGLGHLRRNLAIATAVTEAAPDASVVLLTGCIELGAYGLAPNVEIVALPSLRKLGNGRYGARRLPVSGNELRLLRAGIIGATVERFRPDVLLIDKHPMGVRGELRPAFEALPEWGGRAVLGLRDILDEPARVRDEWWRDGVIEFTEAHCDRLLIYGNPRVFDFAREYRLPATLAGRSHYCGYVVNPVLPAVARRGTSRPTVLATAGGGEDGSRLLRAFVAAAAGADWDAIVVSGPQSSREDRHALQRLALAAGVEFHDSVPDLSRMLPQVDALVSMGGYNTLSEALSFGTPTLCVPRAHPRSEQLIRARSFAELGLLRMIEPELLSPAAVEAGVTGLIASNRGEIAARAREALGFGGARVAAEALLELAAGAAEARSPALVAS